MAADPIRTALHAELAADATLAGLVGDRIFFQVGPQSAAPPMVVFHKQSGTPRWTMSGPPVQSDLWLCKGIATGASSATAAEEIADAIDGALNDASLAIAGHEHLLLLRDSDVSYAEVDEGTLYRHCGAIYRLVSE